MEPEITRLFIEAIYEEISKISSGRKGYTIEPSHNSGTIQIWSEFYHITFSPNKGYIFAEPNAILGKLYIIPASEYRRSSWSTLNANGWEIDLAEPECFAKAAEFIAQHARGFIINNYNYMRI